MKYTVSDFYFLSSAHDLKAQTVEEAYGGMCTFMGYPIPMPCLLHTLRKLVAGGYITVAPKSHVISAATPLTVTAEGKKVAAVTPIQKLLGQEKAHRKNELRFCGLESPELSADSLAADGDSFGDCITRLIRSGDISLPTFEIKDVDDGYRQLTVHHPSDGWSDDEDDEEAEPDAAALSYSASVTCTEEQIKAAIRDLVDTAYLIATEPPRARKVALHGVDGSLLIALANAANEQGLVSFRMTVSRIRFNRQRFVGKRDSDLDYAQCGDPIFIHEMSSAEGFAFYGVLHSLLGRPDLLTEEASDKLSVIHRSLR